MNRPRPASTAFSLVEVTLALGVAAFCLIAIYGLLPIGVSSSQASMEQTVANGLVAAVASDLRATPRQTVPNSPQAVTTQFNLPIPSNGPTASTTTRTLYFTADGQPETALQPDSHYLLTLTFSAATGRAATLADVKVSWPAPATLANASGFVETFVAMDRN